MTKECINKIIKLLDIINYPVREKYYKLDYTCFGWGWTTGSGPSVHVWDKDATLILIDHFYEWLESCWINIETSFCKDDTINKYYIKCYNDNNDETKVIFISGNDKLEMYIKVVEETISKALYIYS
jgi:hypothetical protein